MSKENFVIGIDYGSDSVRALIVNAADGAEMASAVFNYPRWQAGKYCDPAIERFRQHPADYLEGLTCTVREVLSKVPGNVVSNIVCLTVDTTGSTPAPVDENCVPLALKTEFAENPDAMFVLWKDHTALQEADEINALNKRWEIDYSQYSGGIYSPEWFWAKLLHILRKNEKVRSAAFSWVEHCDWMAALLTGQRDPRRIARSRCAAGHKAMWHKEFGGLPSEAYLTELDPLLAGLRERLYCETSTVDEPAGTLCPEWAEKLGLSTGVVIGVGALDAHMGAIGAQIKPGSMIKVMGTSTCDMAVAPHDAIGGKLIPGICGQVDGSIIPGMTGLEAGQSAFGDLYAWFKKALMWPLVNLLEPEQANAAAEQIMVKLDEQARQIAVGQSGIIALDWINGRRTPDANPRLKCALKGLSMGSGAPEIFRALVEATAFGSRRIIERYIEQGVVIEEIIALGGIAVKSPFVMQIVADVLNMPIKVSASTQACALGAAMSAATAAGIYDSLEAAQNAMGSGFATDYQPIAENAAEYDKLYADYVNFGKLIEQQS